MCRNPATHTTIDLLYKFGGQIQPKSATNTIQLKAGVWVLQAHGWGFEFSEFDHAFAAI